MNARAAMEEQARHPTTASRRRHRSEEREEVRRSTASRGRHRSGSSGQKGRTRKVRLEQVSCRSRSHPRTLSSAARNSARAREASKRLAMQTTVDHTCTRSPSVDGRPAEACSTHMVTMGRSPSWGRTQAKANRLAREKRWPRDKRPPKKKDKARRPKTQAS
jgi:hypothetical protein